MKTHRIAFLPCLVIAGVLLLSASAFGDTKPEGSKRAWTILLYGAVDNSADDPFVEFTDQVRRAIDDDPGIELILFIDRSDRHANRATFLGDDFKSSRLYRVKKDSVERLSGGAHFPEITMDQDVNLNSADASTLQRFIAWGKANYPAERYGLLIYSHADGKAMCPDVRTGSEMGIAELTDEIGVEDRVDFLALELCNMGGAEIAYQWRPGNGRFEADVLLAIPNAGPPLDWDRAFSRIRSPGHAANGGSAVDPAKMTAVDFGKLVIEEGLRGRQASEESGRSPSKESAGCYDLRKAGEVKRAVDALAVALAKTESKEILLAIRNGKSESQPICYSNDAYVDLYDLCRRVAGCDRLTEQVRSAAGDVMQVVDRFMIASFGMSHYKQFEAGKNGVFIVLPTGKPNCWKRFRWYTPNRGEGKNYGNWSFLKDGATPGNGLVENWFELLESWFNVAQEEDFRPVDADADKKEKGKLEGTWNSISAESGGKEEPDGRLTLAFKGDDFSITFRKQGDEMIVKGKFSVDPSKQPSTIDMMIEEGPDDVTGQTVQGIYKLEGDELTLCLDEPDSGNRPKEFANVEGTLLVKLGREKK